MSVEKKLNKMNIEEILHHLDEQHELIEQGRFKIQEVKETLSFLTSDMWLCLERIKSIRELIKDE